MQFSLSFIAHFLFSFAGYVLIGIYLCRGSWRNDLRAPLPLAISLIVIGHLWSTPEISIVISKLILISIFVVLFVKIWRAKDFVPAEVRGGHNAFSILCGAALFGLNVQLHYAVTGVSVFELVK